MIPSKSHVLALEMEDFIYIYIIYSRNLGVLRVIFENDEEIKKMLELELIIRMISKVFWILYCMCIDLADTGGRADMKRIYGITAVGERVRLEKGVKVLSFISLSSLLSLSIYYILFVKPTCTSFPSVFLWLTDWLMAYTHTCTDDGTCLYFCLRCSEFSFHFFLSFFHIDLISGAAILLIRFSHSKAQNEAGWCPYSLSRIHWVCNAVVVLSWCDPHPPTIHKTLHSSIMSLSTCLLFSEFAFHFLLLLSCIMDQALTTLP